MVQCIRLVRSVLGLPYSLSLAQTQGIALGTTGEATFLLEAQSICLDSVGTQEKGRGRLHQWEEQGSELQLQAHCSK